MGGAISALDSSWQQCGFILVLLGISVHGVYAPMTVLCSGFYLTVKPVVKTIKRQLHDVVTCVTSIQRPPLYKGRYEVIQASDPSVVGFSVL